MARHFLLVLPPILFLYCVSFGSLANAQGFAELRVNGQVSSSSLNRTVIKETVVGGWRIVDGQFTGDDSLTALAHASISGSYNINLYAAASSNLNRSGAFKPGIMSSASAYIIDRISFGVVDPGPLKLGLNIKPEQAVTGSFVSSNMTGYVRQGSTVPGTDFDLEDSGVSELLLVPNQDADGIWGIDITVSASTEIYLSDEGDADTGTFGSAPLSKQTRDDLELYAGGAFDFAGTGGSSTLDEPGDVDEPDAVTGFYLTGESPATLQAMAVAEGNMLDLTYITVGPNDVLLEDAGFTYSSALGFRSPNFVPWPLGDVNRDGIVDFSDIPAFIDILLAGDNQLEADCNDDGAVDFADIPAFIAILIGS